MNEQFDITSSMMSEVDSLRNKSEKRTMNSIEIICELNKIVDTLNHAICENENAIDDDEKGYAYAAGYSRSAMQMVSCDIQKMISKFN